MSKFLDNFDYVLLAAGGLYSLENIETTLGVVILVIQLIWLIAKALMKIIKLVKGEATLKDVDEAIGDIVDVAEESIFNNAKENLDGHNSFP